jgi:hypothetical protein
MAHFGLRHFGAAASAAGPGKQQQRPARLPRRLSSQVASNALSTSLVMAAFFCGMAPRLA